MLSSLSASKCGKPTGTDPAAFLFALVIATPVMTSDSANVGKELAVLEQELLQVDMAKEEGKKGGKKEATAGEQKCLIESGS